MHTADLEKDKKCVYNYVCTYHYRGCGTAVGRPPRYVGACGVYAACMLIITIMSLFVLIYVWFCCIVVLRVDDCVSEEFWDFCPLGPCGPP